MLIKTLKPNHFICILSIFVIIMLLIFPQTCMTSARDALSMCAISVVPALFPFMVTSNFLIISGSFKNTSRLLAPLMSKLFHLPSAAALPFLLGMVSGYPIGAMATANLVRTKELSKEQGEYMLAFSNNAGPIFIIGSVCTGMLSRPSYGYILLAVHITASLITGILLRPPFTSPSAVTAKSSQSSPTAFTSAVTSSVSSMLSVVGYIVFFAVVTKALSLLNIFSPLAYALHMDQDLLNAIFSGIFEITSGIFALSTMPLAINLKMAIISALIGFSGICILFQTQSAVKEAGLSTGLFFKGKIINCAISSLLTYIIFSFYPETSTVFHFMNETSSSSFPYLRTALFICLIIVIYNKRRPKTSNIRF